MPQSSSKKPTQLAQAIELVAISGQQNQGKAGNLNQKINLAYFEVVA
jgi:hypothetical protein